MDEILDLGGTHIRLHAVHREKELEIPKNQYTKWFDYDKINVGLSIRYRKNGDYLTLSGGGKKLPQVYDPMKDPEKRAGPDPGPCRWRPCIMGSRIPNQ